MSAQENEALVRRFFEEVWAKGNVAAVDEFMAADYVEHTEHAVPPGARPGRDSVKQRIALYTHTEVRQALPLIIDHPH